MTNLLGTRVAIEMQIGLHRRVVTGEIIEEDLGTIDAVLRIRLDSDEADQDAPILTVQRTHLPHLQADVQFGCDYFFRLVED